MNVFDSRACADEYAGGYAGDHIAKEKFAQRIAVGLKILDDVRDTTSSILDVACATGNMIDNLEIMGYKANYVGADSSYFMLEKARGLHPSACFVHSKLPLLPFSDNSFDTVFCLGTLIYIPELRESVFELFRVARRNIIFELSCLPGDVEINTVYNAFCGGVLPVTLQPISFIQELSDAFASRYQNTSEKRYPLMSDAELAGFPDLRSRGVPVIFDEILHFSKS